MEQNQEGANGSKKVHIEKTAKFYEQVQQSCQFGPKSLINLFKKFDKLRTGMGNVPFSSLSWGTLLDLYI